MKTLNKKLALIVAAVLTTTTLLSGCKPTSTTPSTTSNKTPYQLDWYFVGNGPQPDNDKVDAEANKELKDINVQLVTHCLDWGSYQQKMTTLLATNEKIDLLMTALGWGSLLVDDVTKGLLVDLTTLAPKYAPNAVSILKGGFWEGSTINGKNYGFPVNKEKGAQMGFEWNKTYTDKYNLADTEKAVKTIDDVTPMLKTIKAAEPTIFPVEPSTNIVGYLTMDDDPQAGGLVVLPKDSTDDKFVASAASPNFQKVAATVRSWYTAGYIQKDAATVTDVTPFRKAGKNFVAFDSLKPGKATEVSLSTGQTWTQTDIGTPFSHTADVSGVEMSIPKVCKDPTRVLQFVDKIYTDTKLINTIDYGIEGTHYVVKSPGIIDFAPATAGGTKSGYNPGTPWMFGNQFKSYVFTSEDPNKWAAFTAFNKACVKLPACGFVYTDDKVKNEEAACNNVSKEFNPSLQCGSIDPTTNIPKYVAKLQAAGLQTILDDVNSQYAAWKKTQK